MKRRMKIFFARMMKKANNTIAVNGKNEEENKMGMATLALLHTPLQAHGLAMDTL